MSTAALTSESSMSSQATESLFARRYVAVTSGIVALVLLTAFEGLAVGTALPVAIADVGGVSYYSLAATAFATASLFGMVLAGVRCDAYGPRLPLLGGIAVFAAGLLVAGTATTMTQLVLGRALQGFGAGLDIVPLYIVIARGYPESLRAKAFSMIAALWVMPAVVGPLVAGTLTEHLSWRWVFLGVAALIPIPVFVLLKPLSRMTGPVPTGDGADSAAPIDRAAGRLRLRFAAMASVGFGLLQLASQDLTWIAIALAVGAFALLIPSVPKLLPKGTLRAGRGLPTVILMRGVLAGAYFASEYYVLLMLVQERHVSPTIAGLTIVGTALSWFISAAAASRPRFPLSREAMVVVGSGIVVVSLVIQGSAVLLPYPALVVAFGTVFGGLGMGLAFPVISLLTLEYSAPEEQGVNSSSLQIADGFGNILMTGLAGMVFHVLHGAPGTNKPLYVLMFAMTAAAAVAAAVIAPRVKPSAA